MASGAAKRYAQAVLSLAKEQSTLDAWQRDLARLNELMRDEQARDFFANPNVPLERKRAVLDEALAGGQPEARNLAHLLLERRRLEIVPQLYTLYEEGVRAERGIVVADVTTATRLGTREQAGRRPAPGPAGRQAGRIAAARRTGDHRRHRRPRRRPADRRQRRRSVAPLAHAFAHRLIGDGRDRSAAPTGDNENVGRFANRRP